MIILIISHYFHVSGSPASRPAPLPAGEGLAGTCLISTDKLISSAALSSSEMKGGRRGWGRWGGAGPVN